MRVVNLFGVLIFNLCFKLRNLWKQLGGGGGNSREGEREGHVYSYFEDHVFSLRTRFLLAVPLLADFCYV